MTGQKLRTVNIRPGVTVLSVLRHLKYQPWFAIAEFVDNSIQSYLSCRTLFQRKYGDGHKLLVTIDIDPQDSGRIVIRDNAAGIAESDFPRAFRPAEIPPDRSGLSEFGMGMKSAACWFASNWRVRTSALGDPTVKTVTFDIDKIVNDQIEELEVQSDAEKAEAHFTEIVLWNLHQCPAGRTIGKIKEHLTEIYRVFLREEVLIIKFRGDDLEYEEPKLLNAAFFDENNQPVGPERLWRKDISFDFGEGLKVQGFAALRDPASTTHAGFSLFRRRRLVVGSADEKYRPLLIFGHPNDYVYQRLFGELHIEGFEVTHTKDGFRWDENEQPFLELLKEQLDSKDLPLITQARSYRVRASKNALQKSADSVTQKTIRALERHGIPTLTELSRNAPNDAVVGELTKTSLASRRTMDIDFDGHRWRVIVELSDNEAVGDWIEISDSVIAGEQGEGRDLVGIRISLVHPFMVRFVGADESILEPLVRLGVAVALGEKLARMAGGKYVSTVRMAANRLLRQVLSIS